MNAVGCLQMCCDGFYVNVTNLRLRLFHPAATKQRFDREAAEKAEAEDLQYTKQA